MQTELKFIELEAPTPLKAISSAAEAKKELSSVKKDMNLFPAPIRAPAGRPSKKKERHRYQRMTRRKSIVEKEGMVFGRKGTKSAQPQLLGIYIFFLFYFFFYFICFY